MANLDAIVGPLIPVYYAVKYWWLILAILGVAITTVVILKNKKKQMDKEGDAK